MWAQFTVHNDMALMPQAVYLISCPIEESVLLASAFAVRTDLLFLVALWSKHHNINELSDCGRTFSNVLC